MIAKKITVIGVSIFLLSTLVSCGKNYTCECKVTLGSMVTYQSSSTTDPTTRKKAEKICSDKTNLNIIPRTECYLKD